MTRRDEAMEWAGQMAAAVFVLALVGGVVAWLRLRGAATGLSLAVRRNPRRLHVLERLPLGPQQTLHLVRLDGREMLIASSPAGCAVLAGGPGEGFAPGGGARP